MNYVAGQVSDPDAMDSCIGVEFEANNNRIVAYIDQEEISLTYNQAWELRGLVQQAISAYEWHNAVYLYASEGLSTSTKHLMRKDEHEKKGKTLCGQVPSGYAEIIGGWQFSPILGEPSRTKRGKFAQVHCVCQRCLAIYDKAVAASKE